jgi:D-xylose transport system substrate-binding protein
MLKTRKSPKLVLLVFALPAIPLVALAAAGGKQTAATTPGEKPAVAFLLSTLQEERYLKDVRFFEERTRELGIPSITFAADNDNAKQLAQVEDAITLGAKVLVIQPTDSKAAASYVELAKQSGVSVIAYDRSIASDKLDYYVSHDSYRVGVLQAEAAVRATGGKGNYVILAGQAGHSVATEITRGYTDTLARYPGIEVVMQQSHSAWASEQALRTVEDAITRSGGKLAAILANNSGMARGAVQAITNARLENVFIAGADADAANLAFVCEGKQTIEVLKDIQPLAVTAADVAKAILDGKPPTDKMVAVRVEVIAKDAACKLGGAK